MNYRLYQNPERGGARCPAPRATPQRPGHNITRNAHILPENRRKLRYSEWRGSDLKLLLLACGLLAGLAVRAEQQLSFIVLNTPPSPGNGNVPPGWQIKVNRGTPEVSVAAEAGKTAIRLQSHKSSYGLERGVDVDPADLPFLQWRWKVTRLPEGGDFRHNRSDDQAAQVLVAFADRRILSYIWDSTAPKGTMQSASSIPLIHVFAVVCESGMQQANRWLNEVRNVREDYERAYGRSAPRVKGIRLQINSQHTGTAAESWFGEVSFRKTPQ
jgi:hypothetical protein